MSEDVQVSQIEEFAIIFDNDPAVYREGDSVSGTILITNTEDVRYGAIFIELCGIALVQWSVPLPGDEANGDIIDPNDIKQGGDYNREQYFHKKIMLKEKDGGFLEHDPTLEKGQHTYRFASKLPPELPSSFEGQYGQVRYVARAVIERSWKSNVVTKRAFTVLSGLDLNFIPEAAARIEFCKYRTIGTCCNAGSVTADLTVERAGYVPGESVVLNGAVQNECKDAVALSRVCLYMVVEYKARKKRRREKREVVKVEKGVTLPDDTTVWSDNMHIPPLPPTGLSRCRLIDIKYELQFYALIDGGHTPIEYTREIYIGTVPMCHTEMQSCIAGLYNQPYYGGISNNPGGGGGLGGLTDNVFAGTRASQMSLAAIVSVGGARPAPNPSAPPGVLDPDAVNGNPVCIESVGVAVEDGSEVIISGIGLSPTKAKNAEILVGSSDAPAHNTNNSTTNSTGQDESNNTSTTNPPETEPLTSAGSRLSNLDQSAHNQARRSSEQDWDRPPPYAPDHMGDEMADSPAARLIENERPEPHNPNHAPKHLLLPTMGGNGGGGSHEGSTLALTPTYEASAFGTVSLREKSDDTVSLHGDLTYNPLYTYYDTVGKAPE